MDSKFDNKLDEIIKFFTIEKQERLKSLGEYSQNFLKKYKK
jgi:hypothetical protein